MTTYYVPKGEAKRTIVEETYKQHTNTILVNSKKLKNEIIDYISYYGYHSCKVEVIESVSDLANIDTNNVIIVNPNKILQNLINPSGDEIVFISEH